VRRGLDAQNFPPVFSGAQRFPHRASEKSQITIRDTLKLSSRIPGHGLREEDIGNIARVSDHWFDAE
jgi:hypothetical protein